MEREAARLKVRESHFRSHLPPDMRKIAVWGSNKWTSDPYGRSLSPLKRLSEFGCKIHDPDLPEWDIFVGGQANCDGADLGSVPR